MSSSHLAGSATRILRPPKLREWNLDNLIGINISPVITAWTRDDVAWTFQLDDLMVKVSDYRIGPPSVIATSNSMPRRYLDPMRTQLRQPVNQMSELRMYHFAVMLLQLIEESVGWYMTWKPADESLQVKGWSTSGAEGWKAILNNPVGLDLSTVEDTTQHLLGKSVGDICKDLPPWLRVLHVEPVFRKDLVYGFLERKQQILSDLLSFPYEKLRSSVSPKTIPRGSSLDSRAGLAEKLSEPCVTFHGAPRHVISSIVRFGFHKAGDKVGGKILHVRSGTKYDKGIYSSPSAVYASMYASYTEGVGPTMVLPSNIPGMCLVVCSVLMGRPLPVTARESQVATEIQNKTAHSFTSPCQMEYLVFDSFQIIPCYVLHLDYGAEVARREFKMLPNDPRDFLREKKRQEKKARKELEDEELAWPGSVKDQKAARKAAAAKWFPYGYGPAKGGNFVIEEIGEVSDDEEAFGDFQGMRIENEDEIRDMEVRVAKGGSWFDEYQTVRKSNKKL